MDSTTDKILQQMADKLGVTVQYLWQVLVHGNRVEGVICSMFVLAGIVLIYVGYRLIKYELADPYADQGWQIAGIGSVLLGLAGTFGFLYWAVMDLLCPEYGAIADILSHFSNK